MRLSATLLLTFAVAGCDLPRDTAGSLESVRGHVLRVGVTDHPPWDSVSTTTVSGIEPAIVEEIARSLDATPSWRRGSESELLAALEQRELDLVAGGLTVDSPWSARVAFTRPYRTDQRGAGHVLALAPGENALLVHVERFLHDHQSLEDTVGTQ